MLSIVSLKEPPTPVIKPSPIFLCDPFVFILNPDGDNFTYLLREEHVIITDKVIFDT
jgi:hypothetical protein